MRKLSISILVLILLMIPFWLEKNSGKNVSPTRSAKCKGPVYYTNAYSSASETKVYLTAENNNKNGSGYNVSGKWDEETW